MTNSKKSYLFIGLLALILVCSLCFAVSQANVSAYAADTTDISGAEIVLGDKLIYNGQEQTQTVVSVKVGGNYLTAGDYTVSGNTATEASDYKTQQYQLSITGKGAYSGIAYKSFTIYRKEIAIDWCENNFVFDGTDQSGKVTASYTDVAGKKVDLAVSMEEFKNYSLETYLATASFKNNETNYKLPIVVSKSFNMKKATYDMSGIVFADNTTAKETGDSYSLAIAGVLPTGADGVQVAVSYEGNGKTKAGSYTVTAHFTGTANYNLIADKTATLVIRNGSLVSEADVSITSQKGISPDLTLTVTQQSSADVESALSGVLSKRDAIGCAFDVSLLKDGVAQQPDGSFTLKIRIPEDLREKKNLRLIHIHDGQANQVDFEVVDGYAIVNLDSLSSFVFIYDNGLAGWAIALLVIAIVVMLGAIGFLVYYFVVLKKRKNQPAPVVATTVPETEDDEDEDVVIERVDEQGRRFLVRFRKSFTARYIQTSDEIKGYYGELKNAILSYKKVSSRISWAYDSINLGRTKLAKFNVRGKTLYLYIALDPTQLDEKYHVDAVTAKKYADVPCLYKIKNPRRAKYALELIAMLAEKFELKATEPQNVDYYLPYETTEALIAKDLIKEVNTEINDDETPFSSAKQVKEEKPVVEEVAPVNENEEEDANENEEEEEELVVERIDEKGQKILVRFRKSFSARYIQTSDEIKGYYGELKNAILSFKKVSSRISWAYDSINFGRTKLAKFNVRGKTLYLYLALDAEQLDEKYLVKKVESKKYADVPCLYKIKNPRRAKYALELIAQLAEKYALKPIALLNEDYYQAYESTEALIEKGLIKENTSVVEE